MNFQDALVQMQQGQYMVRDSWLSQDAPELGFCCIMPTMKHIWKIMPMPNPNAGMFTVSVEDMQADDWIFLAEQTAKVEAAKAEEARLQAEAAAKVDADLAQLKAEVQADAAQA